MTESRFAKRTWRASRWWATFYHNLKDKSLYNRHDFYADLTREFLLIYNWIRNKEWKKVRIAKDGRFLPMRYNPEVIVSLLVLKWFYHYSHPVKELTNRDLVMIWWLAFDTDLNFAKTYKAVYPDFRLEKLPKSYVTYFSKEKEYDPLDKNSFHSYTKYISRGFFKQSLDKVLSHIQGDYRRIERDLKWYMTEKYIDKRLDFIIDCFKAFVNDLHWGKKFLVMNKLSERTQLKWKTDFEIIASTIDNLSWYDKAPELEKRLQEEMEYFRNNYNKMTKEQRAYQKGYITELEALSPDDRYDEASLWGIRDYIYEYNTKEIDNLLDWETGVNYIYLL